MENNKGRWWSSKEIKSRPEFEHVSLGSITASLKKLRERNFVFFKVINHHYDESLKRITSYEHFVYKHKE